MRSTIVTNLNKIGHGASGEDADSIVKIHIKSDLELDDQMAVTGECGSCEFKHTLSCKSMDERIDCSSYSNRGSELYEHMDTYHMDLVKDP